MKWISITWRFYDSSFWRIWPLIYEIVACDMSPSVLPCLMEICRAIQLVRSGPE